MLWIFASLPLLLFIVLTWFAGGLVVTRRLLRLSDGMSVAALSLPCGMLLYLLLVNALSYFIFVPITVWLVNGMIWVVSFLALRRKLLPLTWYISKRTQIVLLLIGIGFFVFVFLLNAREVWGDSLGHASMVQLLANGQFPLRFQCNPAELAAYQYGVDLLAASAVVTAGLTPWDAQDIVVACTVHSVTSLAFLLTWRRTKAVSAGILSAFMVLTVGHIVWLLLPLASGGLAYLGAGNPQTDSLSVLSSSMQNPWNYAVVPPGFITTNYGHSLRSISWGFGPFIVLLFLVLVDSPIQNRTSKTLVLAYILGTVSLLQPGALVPLSIGFGTYTCLQLVLSKKLVRPDYHPWLVIIIAIFVAIIQGGVITDGVKSVLSGTDNVTVSFGLKPFTFPSCGIGDNNVACALLSVGNMGLIPLLLPWLAWTTFRRRTDQAQIIIVSGAFVSYLLPVIIRYGYTDWNFLRIISFSSWSLTPFVIPLLYRQFSKGMYHKILAVGVYVIATYSGIITAWVIIDGRWIGDTISLNFNPIPAMLSESDAQMMNEASKLPLDALFFDSSACNGITASRPAYLFGRYARSSANRSNHTVLPEGFIEIARDPQHNLLTQYGYTHIYLDNNWYTSLDEQGRNSLRYGSYEVIAQHGEPEDVRLLLRVCEPNESCIPYVPRFLLDLPYIAVGRSFEDKIQLVGSYISVEDRSIHVNLLTEAIQSLDLRYHFSLRLTPIAENNTGVETLQIDGSPDIETNMWVLGRRYEIRNVIFESLPPGGYMLTVRWYDYDSPDLTPLFLNSLSDADLVISSNIQVE